MGASILAWQCASFCETEIPRYLDGFARELDRAFELAVDVLVDAIDSLRAAPDRDALRTLVAELLDDSLLLAAEEKVAVSDDELIANVATTGIPDSDHSMRAEGKKEGEGNAANA